MSICPYKKEIKENFIFIYKFIASWITFVYVWLRFEKIFSHHR